jgi:hypothetical protein
MKAADRAATVIGSTTINDYNIKVLENNRSFWGLNRPGFFSRVLIDLELFKPLYNRHLYSMMENGFKSQLH